MAEPGVYVHSKGGRYRVLFVAFESTNERAGSRSVVYVSLTTGVIHVRAETEFFEPVLWPDGSHAPRFLLEVGDG
jgi:hypothetical protein